MDTLALRLKPGDDLRRAIEAAVAAHGCTAAFVLSGIGSLIEARLRLAGASEVRTLAEDLEILTLAGTTAAGNASHLHASVARASGEVVGGHVGAGCIVGTTAEVLLALLPDWHFTRAPDAATGYDELVVSRSSSPRAAR
jgi:predicted DNA-binding protein with PD1-like motif